jgi:hypothetical protein
MVRVSWHEAHKIYTCFILLQYTHSVTQHSACWHLTRKRTHHIKICVQHNTTQHNTTHHITSHHNATLHNTTHHNTTTHAVDTYHSPYSHSCSSSITAPGSTSYMYTDNQQENTGLTQSTVIKWLSRKSVPQQWWTREKHRIHHGPFETMTPLHRLTTVFRTLQ